jgi:hypothetical protein
VGTTPLAAQTAGNTATVDFNHLFSTTGQSMWGPGTAPQYDGLELFSFGPPVWDVNPQASGYFTIPTSVPDADWLAIKPGEWVSNDTWLTFKPGIPGTEAGFKLGGGVEFESRGHLKVVGELTTADPGGVGVTYPVKAEVEFPEPNSFRDGDEVRIITRYGPDLAAAATPPAVTLVNPTNNFDVNLEFGFSASAELDVCVFHCYWIGLDADDFDFDADGDGSVSFEELFTSDFDPFSTTEKKLFPPIDLPSGFAAGGDPWQATVFRSTSQGTLEFPVLADLMANIAKTEGVNAIIGDPGGLLENGLQVLPHGFSQIETGGCGIPFYSFLNPTCIWKGHGVRGIIDVPRVDIPCVSPFPAPWPRDPRGKDGAPFPGFGVNDWNWGCAATPVSSQLGSDGVLMASSDNIFAEVALDVDHWLQLLISGLSPGCDPETDTPKQCFAKEAGGLKKLPPLGLVVPFDDLGIAGLPTGAQFSYDIVAVEIPFKAEESRNFEFEPELQVEITFPQPVEYRITTSSGAPVAGPTTGTKALVDVGDLVYVQFPSGVKTPLQNTTKYTMDNTFTADMALNFEAGFRQELLKAAVTIPDFDVVTFAPVDFCEGFHLGEWAEDVINEVGSWFGADEVDVPDHCPVQLDPIRAEDLSTTLTSNGAAFDAFQSIDVPSVSLLDETSWTLGGFSPATGTAFDLDPENPIIAVSTDLEPGVLNGLGPAGTLVQSIDVENAGDVYLSMTQVTDALSVAYSSLPGFTVTSILSPALAEDPDFDGVGNVNTLLGSDVLQVGQTSSITVQFQAAAGNVYSTSVHASGRSPIGTDVSADDDGSFAVYAMDIDQDKLIAGGGPKARLPVHVLDSPALPVTDIDPTTVRLDGLNPIEWALTPREDDETITDLVFFFVQGDVLAKAEARAQSTAVAVVAAQSAGETLSAVEIDRLAAAMLEDAELSDDLRSRADELGNGNGRLDVGDLRAALVGSASGPGDPAAAPPVESEVTLPLTGFMSDETPFVAEDAVFVR